MSLSRRRFLTKGAAAATGMALWTLGTQTDPARAADAPDDPRAKGPFQPSWDSLAQYQCPEWFRDAKFGIWAHWTAQCVPEQGDWYARQMYMEGNNDYKYQCEHYGHPSKVGFKDIDHLWHAERWDPERLMDLYQAAGAKYFMALAQHHDNFDCFDSKYQSWNSVALGPKKDIVGTWAKAARKRGMHFGVSSHGSHAWSWYEVAQGADKTGPLAGVPYDGHLTKADGKGQWWEGLDPQELYAQNHAPMGLEWDWNNNGRGDLPNAAYCTKFYNRITDLIDKYHPDLLYFDDTILPLYQVDPSVGLRIAAHHYNTHAKRGGGRTDAVLTGKGLSGDQARCMTQDYERGRSDKIAERPWQTDTCIGSWHYERSVYENHRYKTPDQVVKMLVDIVAKNGNLMLNIPVRGDGTIDSDEVAFLQGMAAWMKVNAESIFATRPWKISGEGPIKIKGGGFSEGGEDRLTPADFRFTTKGHTLYATAMGWPDSGKLVVRTLAAGAAGIKGDVKTVTLLGHGDVPFTRTADGLEVVLPAQKPCDHAYALKITGLDLAASEPAPPIFAALVVQPAADGTLTLDATQADLHGQLQTETHGAVTNIGFWDSARDSASWNINPRQVGTYDVSAQYASPASSELTLALAGRQLDATVQATGDFTTFRTVSLGRLEVAQAGTQVLTVRPHDAASWHAINLASLRLTPAP